MRPENQLPVRPSGHTETRARAEEELRRREVGWAPPEWETVSQLARDVIALIDQAAELAAILARADSWLVNPDGATIHLAPEDAAALDAALADGKAGQ